jgi:pyruvate/2-oxoglutarate/acetoin dehydrogenase E1 component
MEELITYREAVSRAIAQEMRRDDRVYFIGEDVAHAGGVFKATKGLLDEFGAARVRDTPISEEAILGAAMGAAMTGLRPIAEIMFSDFLATCWDLVAVEMAKTRYMTDGQVSLPLVIRTANGGGLRFGAQHSQAVENWAMAVPGLKVVAPSNPHDLIGLFAAAVRDDDPVVFFEQKSLYPTKGHIEAGEIVEELGTAKVLREGTDVTVVPMDTATIIDSVVKTSRLVTVEENPRLCGWGAEVVSIVAEECIWNLDGPLTRITTPHVPLASADGLEDEQLPSVQRIIDGCVKATS